jgi:hypothetical protein
MDSTSVGTMPRGIAPGAPNMTKTIRILAVLLAAQLLLAAGLAAWSVRSAMPSPATALLGFDRNAVDKLTIEGPDKVRTDLVRKDGHWGVTQAGGFAADDARVAQLLGRLAALESGPAVATSTDAAQRFKVADAAFERRVEIDGGGKTLATLMLGTSQGPRQTFARKAGDNAIVGVDLATFEVPAKPDDWLDKGALQVPRGEIEAIDVAGLKLVRQEAAPATIAASAPARAASSAQVAASAAPAAATWRADGLQGDERLDPAAADKLAAALADLRFDALRGRDDSARKDLTTPLLTLQVQRRGGARIGYTLYKLASGDGDALVVSNRPETFTLAAYRAKPLLDAATRAALLAPAK